MKGYKQFILFILTFLFIYSCSTREQKESKNHAVTFLCDAEKLDSTGRYFQDANDQPQTFREIGTRTKEKAHSGNYSIKLTPGNPYGFTTDVKNIGPDQYIRITAWRKSSANSGVIVCYGGEGFYHAGKFLEETSCGRLAENLS